MSLEGVDSLSSKIALVGMDILISKLPLERWIFCDFYGHRPFCLKFIDRYSQVTTAACNFFSFFVVYFSILELRKLLVLKHCKLKHDFHKLHMSFSQNILFQHSIIHNPSNGITFDCTLMIRV